MTKVTKLVKHVDARGYIMEMQRRDAIDFPGFGQSYVCTVNPGVTKAWHKHEIQTDYFVCVKGNILLVLFRPTYAGGFLVGGSVEKYFLGDDNPIGVRIPAGVYHGIKNIGTDVAILINQPTEPFNADNPDEIRQPASAFADFHDWSANVDG